jgi:hypothetical protein
VRRGAVQQTTTDPHTAGFLRPNVGRNLDGWYTAFGCGRDAVPCPKDGSKSGKAHAVVERLPLLRLVLRRDPDAIASRGGINHSAKPAMKAMVIIRATSPSWLKTERAGETRFTAERKAAEHRNSRPLRLEHHPAPPKNITLSS